MLAKAKIMATLNVPQNGQAMKGRSRTRKAAPSVDLTAMVDLAFLLITFFMLTTSLSKYQAMEIAKPVADIPREPVPASRTLTVILGKDDRIVWYQGEPGKVNPEVTDYRSFSKVLMQNKRAIAKVHGNAQDKFMVVVIKPTAASNYKNFVDMLDEMRIGDVKSYMIDDEVLLPAEASYMNGQKLL